MRLAGGMAEVVLSMHANGCIYIKMYLAGIGRSEAAAGALGLDSPNSSDQADAHT